MLLLGSVRWSCSLSPGRNRTSSAMLNVDQFVNSTFGMLPADCRFNPVRLSVPRRWNPHQQLGHGCFHRPARGWLRLLDTPSRLGGDGEQTLGALCSCNASASSPKASSLHVLCTGNHAHGVPVFRHHIQLSATVPGGQSDKPAQGWYRLVEAISLVDL